MPWTKGHLVWVRVGRESTGVILVLRKSLGSAVVRNRLKRRLRHICRDLPRRSPTVSLVVFAQPAAASVAFGQLRDELTHLFSTLEACSGEAK
ncbi:MAG: Ribonuclease protein component [Chloroflexi bacterium]|nr:Ribonuclease protein component [Chloroflexota bacterium]